MGRQEATTALAVAAAKLEQLAGAEAASTFTDGELFERTISTESGNVGVLAETSIDGTTLTLKDLTIYGSDGAMVNQVGARAWIQELNALKLRRLSKDLRSYEIPASTLPEVLQRMPGNPLTTPSRCAIARLKEDHLGA